MDNSEAGQAYLDRLTTAERQKLIGDVRRQVEKERKQVWAQIVTMYHARELYAADVADVLRAGYAPTPEALPIIADILMHEGLPLKSTGRPKTIVRDGKLRRQVEAAADYVQASRDSGKSVQDAQEYAAAKLGLSQTTIKNAVRKNRNGNE